MRLSFLLSTAILAALAITEVSAQTSVELPATGSNLPLVAWFAVMFMVAVAGATTVYRWLGK